MCVEMNIFMIFITVLYQTKQNMFLYRRASHTNQDFLLSVYVSSEKGMR